MASQKRAVRATETRISGDAATPTTPHWLSSHGRSRRPHVTTATPVANDPDPTELGVRHRRHAVTGAARRDVAAGSTQDHPDEQVAHCHGISGRSRCRRQLWAAPGRQTRLPSPRRSNPARRLSNRWMSARCRRPDTSDQQFPAGNHPRGHVACRKPPNRPITSAHRHDDMDPTEAVVLVVVVGGVAPSASTSRLTNRSSTTQSGSPFANRKCLCRTRGPRLLDRAKNPSARLIWLAGGYRGPLGGQPVRSRPRTQPVRRPQRRTGGRRGPSWRSPRCLRLPASASIPARTSLLGKRSRRSGDVQAGPRSGR